MAMAGVWRNVVGVTRADPSDALLNDLREVDIVTAEGEGNEVVKTATGLARKEI
ncbi:MAG: hypothetical protein ACJ74U_13790 [Jatrophihabitantaceae bacterium]